MQIEVTLSLSRAYYRECFTEWLAARSKYRKWQPLSAGVLLAAGAGLWAAGVVRDGPLWVLPGLLVFLGVAQLWDFYTTRRQWLRARTGSALVDQTVAITFSEAGIAHHGPFSTGTLAWAGLEAVQETPNGLFLVPENGISIYLPKKVFASPNQVQEIIQWAQK